MTHCSLLQVLVIDGCNGLITAAVAERLGGLGRVCSLALGNQQAVSLDAVKHMNFTTTQKAAICTATISDLLAALQVCCT
jgi:tRNA (adenine58-N1)-methyltransferase non-catalytic subunit